jgi:site-specific recombinase
VEETTELHHDPEAAAEMAVNAVISYLRACGLKEADQRIEWVTRVFERVVSREFPR